MSLSTGQVLNNRYRIEALLGQGGFGAVYKALDTNLGEPVAIKESFGVSTDSQNQFQFEAKILFRIKHDHLPRVHDYFVIPGLGRYLVMDFVEGEDLETLLTSRGGLLPEDEVLRWIGQVCDALTYLHSQTPPIIHRDVKPANIHITPDGRAILVDFGLSKEYNPRMVTVDGARGVTAGFSPPEQYGSHGTDARADIYALGATVYMLLTGRVPVEAPNREPGVSQTSPRTLNWTVSDHVDRAVIKAMEMRPADRYQSVAVFKAALQTAPKPVSFVYQPSSPQWTAQNYQPRAPADALQPMAAPPPAAMEYSSAPASLPADRSGDSKVRRALPPLLVGGFGLAAFVALCFLGLGAAYFWNSTRAPSSLPPVVTEPIIVVEAASPTTFVHNETIPTAVEADPTAVPTLEALPMEPTRTPTPPLQFLATTAPGPALQPGATSTEPPGATPHLLLTRNSNCRGGPANEFELIWTFFSGNELEIVGQDGDWWLVQFSDPGTSHDRCWIYATNGTPTGNIAGVPFSDYRTIK